MFIKEFDIKDDASIRSEKSPKNVDNIIFMDL